VALTAAQISALHQAGNQLEQHGATTRTVATQLAALQLVPDYNTAAGVIIEEFKQNLVAKLHQFSTMLEDQAAAHHTTAGGFTTVTDDAHTAASALLAQLM